MLLSIVPEKGRLPGFPFIIEFSSQNNSIFDIEIVMHEKTRKKQSPTPLIYGKS